MYKCPFCGSENTELLSTSDGLFRKCVRNGVDGMESCTVERRINYPFAEELCLDCGYVFKKMDDEVLKDYIEDKPYFV